MLVVVFFTIPYCGPSFLFFIRFVLTEGWMGVDISHSQPPPRPPYFLFFTHAPDTP